MWSGTKSINFPPGAEFVLPNLVLPTIVFLALGLGVGNGIVVTICSYSNFLVKSEKKEEDNELDSLSNIIVSTYVHTYNTPPIFLPKSNMTKR